MSYRPYVSSSLEADDCYAELEEALFATLPDGPLFQTDADPVAMWHAYLDNIPAGRRQYYNCHCCRHFIQRFGGLVTIDDNDAHQESALWCHAGPSFFYRSIDALYRTTKSAKVVGVFLSSDKVFGTPRTGEWTHLAARNPKPFNGRVQNAWQAMAEKLEDYKMLCHGLADYSRDTVEQAVRVLKADAVYRSEKATGIAEWFLNLHVSIKNNPHAKRNLTWLAVATAPPGFSHVRSTMISTLLDDINARLPFNDIARRWKDKMHPLQYQRPTAPAKEGTIRQAEELVAKLGIERSLLRRYATLDDVLLKLWVPRDIPPASKPGGGVFDHLRNQPHKSVPIELPATNITWEKFKRTVLPHALKMEIDVPHSGGFCGLMTAVDYDAPPIIQWDGLAGHPRNPVSRYYWNGGSPAWRWGLSPGWNEVTCMFPNPSRWQEPEKFRHEKDTIHFAIKGCVEQRPESLALFPEILKSELHGIRSVIEAHSNRGGCGQYPENGNANGLTFDGKTPVQLRVRTPDGWARYNIDRMD